MKEYYEKQYERECEGLYEKEYEAMELGEKLESMLCALEGIGDVLGKLLLVCEAGLEKETKEAKKPRFKVGASSEYLGEAGADVIARGFGNV